MKTAGIIAEYNPFHNGHAHQLTETRRSGATHIAVVMSGPFVQRGDIACFSKFARARAAVACGADLVAELTLPHAIAAAPDFARAGVLLLNRLGMESLSFGSETETESTLPELARQAHTAEISPEMSAALARGMSYPRARSAAMDALFGPGAGERIARPNNLLAVEYLCALQKINPAIHPLVIPRAGIAHDSPQVGSTQVGSTQTDGRMASGSALRLLLAQGELSPAARYLPPAALPFYEGEIAAGRGPVFQRELERLALGGLRSLPPEGFAALPGVAEGFENRLYRAARAASSLQGFYEAAKTKRFTMARIRRIAWCALLGIGREEQAHPPAYLRILALNRRGTEILAAAGNSGTPIGTSFADLFRLAPAGIERDVRANDLFSLAMPQPQPCGMDFTQKLYLQEDSPRDS